MSDTSEVYIEDKDTIVYLVDTTQEDCGCVIRFYSDGRIVDSGCFRHMPHDSESEESRGGS